MKKYLFILSVSVNILSVTLLLGLGYMYHDKIIDRLSPQRQADILLIGDSRIAQENWQNLLGRTDIRNCAAGGLTTQQILWGVERGNLNCSPEICILEGGINDLLMGIPVERICNNFQAIISLLEKNKVIPVLQTVIYTTDDPEVNLQVTEVNNCLKKLSLQHNICLLDINSFLSDGQRLNPKLSNDGIHLKAEAYEIWSGHLNLRIDSLLRKEYK